jgi:hypothetical protein
MQNNHLPHRHIAEHLLPTGRPPANGGGDGPHSLSKRYFMSITEAQVNVSGITLFASGTQAVPASGWMQVPGGLTGVSAGSLNQVWGVNARNSTIYKFQNGVWVNIPGGLTCVSAAADGTVWGVNSSGNIYRRDGSTWTLIPGGLSQISVGSATQV